VAARAAVPDASLIHARAAGWYEAEHEASGFAFPSLAEGDGAYNDPKPIRGDIPILIGGSGERKTLRLVAQYADGCNLDGDPERAEELKAVGIEGPTFSMPGVHDLESVRLAGQTLAPIFGS
jgi:hypothetical protein